MGRHTAPIPIVTPSHGAPRTRRVTDPKLLDRPVPPEDASVRLETAALPGPRDPRPAPAWREDDDGVDEPVVDLAPRSASSVLHAEALSGAPTTTSPRPRPTRALEIASAVIAVLALALAVVAAVISR